MSYQKCDKGEDEETLKNSLLSNRDEMSQEVIFHLKKKAILNFKQKKSNQRTLPIAIKFIISPLQFKDFNFLFTLLHFLSLQVSTPKN